MSAYLEVSTIMLNGTYFCHESQVCILPLLDVIEFVQLQLHKI